MPNPSTALPATPRFTRPLYLKKVPTDVWERVHVNAIRSGMRLSDYLVSVLALTEPITVGRRTAPHTASPSHETPSAGPACA